MKPILLLLLFLLLFATCKKNDFLSTDSCKDFIVAYNDTLTLTQNQEINFIESVIYLLQPTGWNYDHYSWSTGATTSSITVSATGVYFVSAYNASDQKVDSASFTIRDYPAYILAPNSFTPDGDGTNDKWRPICTNICSNSYTAVVYDQLDVAVFETHDPNYGWDGTFKGKIAKLGYYTYQIQAINIKGEIISKKGTINILR